MKLACTFLFLTLVSTAFAEGLLQDKSPPEELKLPDFSHLQLEKKPDWCKSPAVENCNAQKEAYNYLLPFMGLASPANKLPLR